MVGEPESGAVNHFNACQPRSRPRERIPEIRSTETVAGRAKAHSHECRSQRSQAFGLNSIARIHATTRSWVARPDFTANLSAGLADIRAGAPRSTFSRRSAGEAGKEDDRPQVDRIPASTSRRTGTRSKPGHPEPQSRLPKYASDRAVQESAEQGREPAGSLDPYRAGAAANPYRPLHHAKPSVPCATDSRRTKPVRYSPGTAGRIGRSEAEMQTTGSPASTSPMSAQRVIGEKPSA